MFEYDRLQAEITRLEPSRQAPSPALRAQTAALPLPQLALAVLHLDQEYDVRLGRSRSRTRGQQLTRRRFPGSLVLQALHHQRNSPRSSPSQSHRQTSSPAHPHTIHFQHNLGTGGAHHHRAFVTSRQARRCDKTVM